MATLRRKTLAAAVKKHVGMCRTNEGSSNRRESAEPASGTNHLTPTQASGSRIGDAVIATEPPGSAVLGRLLTARDPLPGPHRCRCAGGPPVGGPSTRPK